MSSPQPPLGGSEKVAEDPEPTKTDRFNARTLIFGALIGLGGVAIGIVASVVTTLVQLDHQTQQARVEFTRSQKSALYSDYDEWGGGGPKHHGQL
jgi:hypothetical protein